MYKVNVTNHEMILNAVLGAKDTLSERGVTGPFGTMPVSVGGTGAVAAIGVTDCGAKLRGVFVTLTSVASGEPSRTSMVRIARVKPLTGGSVGEVKGSIRQVIVHGDRKCDSGVGRVE